MSLNIASRNAQLSAYASRMGDSVLTIYSGSVPANSDASIGAAVALVAHDLAGFDTPSAGAMTASAIADEEILVSGTASFARLEKSGEVKQLSVGTSGTEVIVSSTTYTSGQDSIITSLTVAQT